MIQRKKRFSWLLMLFWGGVFVVGLYQVYLFLQGGSFRPEMKKGYMKISSESSVFIDNEYAFRGYKDDQYLVGKYDICFRELGFESRCLSGVEITSNDEDITTIKGEVLLPDEKNIKVEWLTDEEVYFVPKSNGFFWHDSLKKQIFWGGHDDELIHSTFLSGDIESIDFDELRGEYCLTYVSDELVPIDKQGTECLDYWPRELSFSPFAQEALYDYETHSVARIYPGQSFLENARLEQRLVFSEEAEHVPLTARSSLLVFDEAVFLFSENAEDLRLVTRKDSGTQIRVMPTQKEIYFIKNDSFWRLYL